MCIMFRCTSDLAGLLIIEWLPAVFNLVLYNEALLDRFFLATLAPETAC